MNTELHVTPLEFSKLRDWTLLHESEFLGKVYERWPWLRDNPPGTSVTVVVDWRGAEPGAKEGKPDAQTP